MALDVRAGPRRGGAWRRHAVSGNDPTCSGTTYHAGDVWVEHPGVVHDARNEGTVAAVVNATYLGVAVGGSVRIDEAQPANCA